MMISGCDFGGQSIQEGCVCVSGARAKGVIWYQEHSICGERAWVRA